MTPPANLGSSYTHAPRLHHNLFLGSLHLLFWLIFHPSAWRNHLARIDPSLSPNFAITELSRQQWRNPQLRRLLLMSYGVLPGLVGLVAGSGLWGLGLSATEIALGVIGGVVFATGVSLAGSMVIGAAASLVLSVIVGIFAGTHIGLGLASGWIIQNSSEVNVTFRAVSSGFMIGLAGGLVGSIASGTMGRNQDYGVVRQIGSVIVGILMGGVILFIGRNILTSSANLPMISLAISGLGGVVISWRRGLISGLLVALLVYLAFTLAHRSGNQVALEVTFFVALIILPYFLTERLAGAWAGAMASVLGGGGGWLAAIFMAGPIPRWSTLFLSLGCILLGLTLPLWGPLVFYPLLLAWDAWLGYLDKNRPNPTLLRYHSAFWDEHQPLRLLGLEKHLLRLLERSPAEGQAASDFLFASRQRWAAQTAQIELEARWLESCTEVAAIGSVYRSLSAGELVGPASALLRSFSRMSQDVLAALSQESSYNQRLALSAVEDRLDTLLRELTRSSEPYALRFRPIATQWRQVVADHVQELIEVVKTRQEINNPYVIGVPLTDQQEIFVGRTDISAHIEQLLLDRRQPPILLYGQRRIGKTSLLNNLGRLLPSTIIPLFVDLQGPATQATDYTGFFYNLARGMISSARWQRNLVLPPLNRESLVGDPVTRFDEWLDEVEAEIGQNTVLLALDEFEALEEPLADGRFSEGVILGMFRHLIQHRPRFKVLLTGSHALDEFRRWASYLINVQVVHISYLSETEARQLIERPIQNFVLRYEAEASQRVLVLTRGHPALIQLLCYEIVAFKNEQDPLVRRQVCLADVETALLRALKRGYFFFADIEGNQIDPAALALLRFLAAQGEGAIVSRETLAHQVQSSSDLDQPLALLQRRELIEAVNKGYRFQVEMIRCWFAQN
ncbi:MAG: ATP-binding protein [Anaerolineae bacterium]|nr:ATP-binding protein [Anaerolineae bacterium]